MTTDAGALIVTPAKDGSRFYFEAFWRHERRAVKRRLGVAWVQPRATPIPDLKGWQGKYKKRPGSPTGGELTPQQAVVAMREAIETYAASVPQRGSVTFAEAGASWLAEPHGWKPATLRDNRSMLSETAPLRALASKRLDKITSTDIEAFLRTLTTRDGTAPASARTVNKYRSTLSLIFDHAIGRGWIKSNPCSDVKVRRVPGADELVVYSLEQIASIAREADDELGALIVVAATCGLRRGEILELRWRDVSFSERAIHVRRSLSAGTPGPPKSGKPRVVPLSAWPAQELARVGQRSERTRPGDLVFDRADGRHLDGDVVSERYRRARDAAAKLDAELPPLRFHDLRHTFGTLCAAKGLDAVTIKTFMGHADLATTQIYMHFAPQADHAERLSAIFERPEGHTLPVG